jgi:hypothetical protein
MAGWTMTGNLLCKIIEIMRGSEDDTPEATASKVSEPLQNELLINNWLMRKPNERSFLTKLAS